MTIVKRNYSPSIAESAPGPKTPFSDLAESNELRIRRTATRNAAVLRRAAPSDSESAYLPGIDICGPGCPIPCLEHVIPSPGRFAALPPSKTAHLDVQIVRPAENGRRVQTPAENQRRRTPQAAVAAPYLEQKAKTHKFRADHDADGMDEFGPLGTCDFCPGWETQGECRTGDQVRKIVVCGKDWCGRCGKEGSDAHKRRISRWLAKAMQMGAIAHLIPTIPPALRWKYRSAEAINDLFTRFTRSMVNHGITRGLRAVHLFGDDPPGDKTPEYHPHGDILFEHLDGYGDGVPWELVARLKRSWRELLGITCDCGPGRARGVDWITRTLNCQCVDVHYNPNIAREPGEKYHRLKYALRPIFLDYAWDEPLAYAMARRSPPENDPKHRKYLSGVRRMQAWGKWEGEAVWEAPESDDPPSEALIAAVAGSCPSDGSEIVWQSGVFPMIAPDGVIWRDLGGGFSFAQGRPPEIHDGIPKTGHALVFHACNPVAAARSPRNAERG